MSAIGRRPQGLAAFLMVLATLSIPSRLRCFTWLVDSNYSSRGGGNRGIVILCPRIVADRLVYFDYNTDRRTNEKRQKLEIP